MLKEIIKKMGQILRERKECFLLGGIILLGLGLRLINIGVEPYWSDELLSLITAKHYLGDISGLWNYLQIAEVHPPLYYYLVQGWGSLFGFGEMAIRSLSLIFSLGLILLTYRAGILLFNNKKIGLLAAFITAILPMQIEYGQEARPYAIYCFFGILSVILLAKYFQTQRMKNRIGLLLGFAGCSIIGLYLHYSYVLLLIPLVLYWLGKLIIQKNRKEFIWWLITMAIIFLGFFPWLPALIFKTFLINNIHTSIPRNYSSIRPADFFENALNGLIWTDKQMPTIVETITALLAKLMFFGIITWIIKDNLSWIKKYKDNLIYLSWLFITSLLIFFILPSSTNYTVLIYRHIIFDSIILAIILGAIFRQIKNIRWRTIAISLFIVSLVTFQIKIISDDSQYDTNHRFKIVVDYINEQYVEGDMLIANTSFVRPQLNYYLNDNIPGFIGFFPDDIILPDFMAEKDTLGMIENESQLRYSLIEWPNLDKKMNYLIKKEQPKRVWVFSDGSLQQIRKWFVFNGWKVAFEPISDLFPLTLYVK